MRRIRASARLLVGGGGDGSVLQQQQQRWLWPLLLSQWLSKGEGERKCAVWTTLAAAIKLESDKTHKNTLVAVNLESDKTHKNTLVAVKLESDKAHQKKLYLVKIRIWLIVVFFLGTNAIILYTKNIWKVLGQNCVFLNCKFDPKNWKFLDITKVKKNQLTKSGFFFFFFGWHFY